MKPFKTDDFKDRLKSQADAKKALLERMKPKPTVTAPVLVDRESERQKELERVRAERAAAKEARRLAREQAEAEAARARFDAEQAALEARRAERKERKQSEKADAQQRRVDKLAAYSRLRVGEGRSVDVG